MFNDPKQKARFGWCMYDWANSAFATVILASVLPVYFASLVPEGGAPLWGRTVPATALWGYTVSCSMVLVALTAPQLGALADRRGLRKRLLTLFCLAGATATALLACTGPGQYLLAATLFIAANFAFASGNVFYNAFLPTLAGARELDRLSARGFAFGYLGGGLALLMVFVLVQWHAAFGLPDRAAATRAGFLLTGLWWALFALPALLFLQERVTAPAATPFRGYLKVFGELRRYRDLIVFLAAFLFYNDGIQTVIAVAAIFAREELSLGTVEILGCFLMIQFVAMPGTLLFGRLAERAGAKRAVAVSLLLFIAVAVYAFYLREGWQFWLLSFVVALIFGGSQAVSRSLFSALVPPGKESEFFGFYAISAKFASIFGPLVFALIADLTGSARHSILALAIFFVAGMLLLATVDMERGKAAARGAAP